MSLITRTPERTLSRWNDDFPAFRGLQSLQQEMNQLFEGFFRGDRLSDDSFFKRSWDPAVDIIDEQDRYVLKAELPGVAKEDVRITLENDRLTISGEKRMDSDKKEGNARRIERSYGMFERSFAMPGMVKTQEIDAQYANGVLTITLPKDERAKPRSIEVKVK